MMTFRLPFLLVLAACCLALPTRSQAAQSYDSCAGFIDSVPATITTQGVWCLRKDLSTSVTSGNAITIATNNVTLDCNDFKLGGLAAGDASYAGGISAENRQNTTVRNCNVRGFYYGISINGGAGHVVEQNRLDNNLSIGIHVINASNSVVRHNHVFDTGGHLSNIERYGIYSFAGDAIQIADNFITGVVGTAGYDIDQIGGIYRGNYDAAGGHTVARITGNSIAGLDSSATGLVAGFESRNYGNTAGRIVFAGNHLFLTSTIAGSLGVYCSHPNNLSMRDNVVWGFATEWSSACMDDGGNIAR